MEERPVILSADGYRKLDEELGFLRSVRRRDVAERIKQARSFGDITENSEYEDAKNEQAFIEGRILTLEKILRNASILKENSDRDKVAVGSSVLLQDLEYNDEVQYTIVSSAETDPSTSRISDASPVGRALLGKKAGDEISVRVPAGIAKYRVLRVS
ncbi:MAG: transcription elongation factor GreA [Bacillota bacterium]|nr:transcription elongation factor GreA [Bacillota bacterium]